MSNTWRTAIAPILSGIDPIIGNEPLDDLAELDEGQVAALLGVARTSLVNYRSSRRLKIPHHDRDGSPAYYWKDVRAFMTNPENIRWDLAKPKGD